VIYTAAAALPHDDRQSAAAGLRGQLQIMATAAGATPDWTTLAVAGPTEMMDPAYQTRFEWTASVAVQGVPVFDALPDPDTLFPAGTVEDATMPFRVACFSH
jgi:hypothetical protein